MSFIKRHTQDIPVTISADPSYQPQHPMFQNAEPKKGSRFSLKFSFPSWKKKIKPKNESTILRELAQFDPKGKKITKKTAIEDFNSLINYLKKDSVNSLTEDMYKEMMRRFLKKIRVTISDDEKFSNKKAEIKKGINNAQGN